MRDFLYTRTQWSVCAWRGSLLCVLRPICDPCAWVTSHIFDMTCYVQFILDAHTLTCVHVTWLIAMCRAPYACAWRDVFMCDVPHVCVSSYVQSNLDTNTLTCVSVTWLIAMCLAPYSWHNHTQTYTNTQLDPSLCGVIDSSVRGVIASCDTPS